MTGAGEPIVEIASSDGGGNMHFANSQIANQAIAWTNISRSVAQSITETRYRTCKFGAGVSGIWGATFENGARAFFSICHF
jgi:hypothetical protein